MFGIVAADENIVQDGKVGRSRPVGEDAQIAVLEAAMFHRQPAGTGDELGTGPGGNRGVAESDAFKIIVVGSLQIEEIEIAATVENHIAGTGRLDHNRL